MTSAIIHGNILAEFENMRIDMRLQKAYDVFDSLRETKRRAPYQPKRWSSIFAPTGSGKSTAIRMHLENIVGKEAVKRDFPGQHGEIRNRSAAEDRRAHSRSRASRTSRT